MALRKKEIKMKKNEQQDKKEAEADEEAGGAPAQNTAAHSARNIMNPERPQFNALGKSPQSIKSIQEKVRIYLQR